jgi:hypothetical protein
MTQVGFQSRVADESKFSQWAQMEHDDDNEWMQ